MNAEVIISGSGGQGVLFIGRLLSEASLLQGYEVVWLPTYGGEKRGGSSSCYVTISDEEIGAIYIAHPSAAVAMNETSFKKLAPIMKKDGLLVVNQSLVLSRVTRDDIRTVYVAANELAEQLGDQSVSNIVVLGALVAGLGVVSKSSVLATLDNTFSKNKNQLELNKRAFNLGYAAG